MYSGSTSLLPEQRISIVKNALHTFDAVLNILTSQLPMPAFCKALTIPPMKAPAQLRNSHNQIQETIGNDMLQTIETYVTLKYRVGFSRYEDRLMKSSPIMVIIIDRQRRASLVSFLI